MSHIEYFSANDEVRGIFAEFDQAMRDHAQGHVSREVLIEKYGELVQAGGLQRFVETHLERMEADPEYSPTWISGTECPIIANPVSVLSLRCFTMGNEIQAIYGAPGDLIFTLLSANPVRVSVYRPVDASRDSAQTIDRTEVLACGQSIRVSSGQAFRIDGGSAPAVLARLMIGLNEFTPVYDANTLQYMSMLSLNPSNSRWSFMAQVASLLRPEAAAPILERLTTHHDYDVRWKALQGLFDHDVARAMQVLADFRNDPSEDIAAQARAEHARISELINAQA